MSFKKWLVGSALTSAIAGGGYELNREQEYVVMPPMYADANVKVESMAFGVPVGNTRGSNLAFKVKSTRWKKWKAAIPAGTIVEDVIVYKHFAEPQWTCERCIASGIQPPPIDPPSPPPIGSQTIDWGIARVHAPEAQAIQNGSSIKTCIIDTGVDKTHPDLKVTIGRNFTTADPNDFQDRAGHGTHVFGLVAAINNGIGVLGASQAQVLMCKGLGDNGSGSQEALSNCLVWCVNSGASVVNESFGSPQPSEIMRQAHAWAVSKGVHIYVAAGNSGAQGNPLNYPAAYQLNNLFAIGATNSMDQKASFSSYGPHVKLWAPGENILSTCMGGTYCRMSGTSMACPIAAGIGALARASQRPIQGDFIGGLQITNALRTVQ